MVKQQAARAFDLREKPAGMKVYGDLMIEAPQVVYGIPNKMSIVGDSDGRRYLVWDHDPDQPIRYGPPPGGCLNAFIALHDAAEEPHRILEFAQTHGVLHVCEHRREWSPTPWRSGLADCPDCTGQRDEGSRIGQPDAHVRLGPDWLFEWPVSLSRMRLLLQAAQHCWLLGQRSRAHEILSTFEGLYWPKDTLVRRTWTPENLPRPREPVEAWVFYARQIRAILCIAADLLWEDPTRADDWAALPGWGLGGGHPQMSVSDQRQLVALAVDQWVGAGPHSRSGVTELHVAWPSDEEAVPRIEVSGWGLRGALAKELAATVWSPSPAGPYRCTCCGAPYKEEYKRKPDRTGRRGHYCPRCAADDYLVVRRERKREQYWGRIPTPKRNSKYRTKDGQPR